MIEHDKEMYYLIIKSKVTETDHNKNLKMDSILGQLQICPNCPKISPVRPRNMFTVYYVTLHISIIKL